MPEQILRNGGKEGLGCGKLWLYVFTIIGHIRVCLVWVGKDFGQRGLPSGVQKDLLGLGWDRLRPLVFT